MWKRQNLTLTPGYGPFPAGMMENEGKWLQQEPEIPPEFPPEMPPEEVPQEIPPEAPPEEPPPPEEVPEEIPPEIPEHPPQREIDFSSLLLPSDRLLRDCPDHKALPAPKPHSHNEAKHRYYKHGCHFYSFDY